MNRLKKIVLSFFILLLLVGSTKRSDAQQGIPFQGLIKENNLPLIHQPVFLQFSVINSFGEISYEETQTDSSNSQGIISAIIGQGTLSDNSGFDSIEQIDWENTPMQILIFYRLNEIDPFELLDQKTLNSVVYAYYTPFAEGKGVGINQLLDVEQGDSLRVGDILRFRDTKWNYLPEAKTAFQAGLVGNAGHADTALIAWVLDSAFYFMDTVPNARKIDSVRFSYFTANVNFSNASGFADTVQFADSIAYSLDLQGNLGEMHVGSMDDQTVDLITHGQIRVLLGSNGKLKFGNAVADTGFVIEADNGFLVEYLDDNSPVDTLSEIQNGMYFNPWKKSFHLGNVDLYTKADSGLYCMSGGYNSLANSYSFAWGENNRAIGFNGVVFGENSNTTSLGLNQFGSGVAIGINCTAHTRSVALGYQAKSISGSTNIAIGMNIENSGSTSTSFGSGINNQAIIGGAALGRNISLGSFYSTFVFADSNQATVSSTTDYQFISVASGGTVFYTDSLMVNGISLSPGSGSWSGVSNRYVKDNYREVNMAEVKILLNKLPVYSWNYKTQSNNIVHIGPLSNDLVGNNFFSIDKIGTFYGLSSGDMDGLILMGIQYVDEQINELILENGEAESIINEPEMIKNLEQRIAKLEKGGQDE